MKPPAARGAIAPMSSGTSIDSVAPVAGSVRCSCRPRMSTQARRPMRAPQTGLSPSSAPAAVTTSTPTSTSTGSASTGSLDPVIG